MQARNPLCCRVCHAPVAADALECPTCGSRRPFVCLACGQPVEAPLNPRQLLADGTVVCTRHAPWATCALCGSEGIYTEASAGGWVYLGSIGAEEIRERYPDLAPRLSRLHPGRRWICPSCDPGARPQGTGNRPGCARLVWLACALRAIWHLIR